MNLAYLLSQTHSSSVISSFVILSDLIDLLTLL